jgi:mono/diheme cytochrome c family protein
VVCSAPVRVKWLLVILGPSLLMIAGSIVALLLLPHPVPKTATGAQRVYLTHCASCHGADGRGSWRATLFLLRPGNLADAAAVGALTDDYLFALIKHGGAYVRTLPERAPGRQAASGKPTDATGSR